MKGTQMKRADVMILIAIVVVLLALLWAAWCRPSIAESLSNTVLILTGAVVLWYTIETARIRRDAESRSRRESLPKVYFDVQQLPEAAPQMIDQEHLKAPPSGCAQAAGRCPFRFQIVNNSENFGFALIRIRGKSGNTILSLPGTSEYGGGGFGRSPRSFD